jgi:hypothetical protein
MKILVILLFAIGQAAAAPRQLDRSERGWRATQNKTANTDVIEIAL